MKKIGVVLVEDKADMRAVVKDIINLSEECICLGAVGTPEEARDFILTMKPEVVLMDVHLNASVTGIDLIRELKPQVPSTQFMIFSVFEDEDTIFDALRAGATGYLIKKTDPSDTLAAIKELSDGVSPMSRQIARKVIANFKETPASENPNASPSLDALTAREREILEQLAKGLIYKEIASNVNLSPETVRKHVYNIYLKLHVSNRVEAVNRYYGR
ncbi:MAG: response regulator [Bacteroidota bacterium]